MSAERIKAALEELVALKKLRKELDHRLLPSGNEVALKRALREDYEQRREPAWNEAIAALAEDSL